jgi:hypothetical protein
MFHQSTRILCQFAARPNRSSITELVRAHLQSSESRRGVPLATLAGIPAIAAAVSGGAPSITEDALLQQLAVEAELNEFYFLANNTPGHGERVVVPCDWKGVMRSVSKTIPVEGVLGSAFWRCVKKCHEQVLQAGVSETTAGPPLHVFQGPSSLPPGISVESWIRKNFSDYISATRSRTDSSLTIYRPLDGQIGDSQESESDDRRRVVELVRALAYIGKDASPVFTSIRDVQPVLLGTALRGEKRWSGSEWARLVSSPSDSVFRRAFDVEVDILVSPKTTCETASVFVDGSSTGPGDVDAALARLLPSSGSSLGKFIVTRKSVFRHAHNPPHPRAEMGSSSSSPMSDEDHVVSAALDVLHELSAAVLADSNTSSIAVGRSRRVLIVVCGEGTLESIKEMLGETCFVPEGVRVVVATPLQAIQIR